MYGKKCTSERTEVSTHQKRQEISNWQSICIGNFFQASSLHQDKSEKVTLLTGVAWSGNSGKSGWEHWIRPNSTDRFSQPQKKGLYNSHSIIKKYDHWSFSIVLFCLVLVRYKPCSVHCLPVPFYCSNTQTPWLKSIIFWNKLSSTGRRQTSEKLFLPQIKHKTR